MVKHRSHSIEFKRQIAQEFMAGGTLHALAKRHDISRNLIRIWVKKLETGAFDEDAQAADLLQEYEARIAALERMVGRQARRVGAELRHQGIVVNSKKIRRLMREHDLQPKRRRRFVATTDSDHDDPIFPDLARGRIVDGPNQLWVADITYIAIATGFVYLAAILDAWSRCVVGYAISRIDRKAHPSSPALRHLPRRRTPSDGPGTLYLLRCPAGEDCRR